MLRLSWIVTILLASSLLWGRWSTPATISSTAEQQLSVIAAALSAGDDSTICQLTTPAVHMECELIWRTILNDAHARGDLEDARVANIQHQPHGTQATIVTDPFRLAYDLCWYVELDAEHQIRSFSGNRACEEER